MLHILQFRRVVRSVKRVANTRYPKFIFGLQLNQGELPVFIYHEVDRESFAADLMFLRDNDYQTLSTSEFVEYGYSYSNRRAVLLTFDDARRNFWDVTFPLLREFNARATVFAPTYWIGGGKHRSQEETVPQTTELFMTWEQLRACANSGLVDVQSHAHRHALVYTSTRLVGFASPQSLARYHFYDWPMRRTGHGDVLGRPVLGTPIYEAIPLLSARSRVIEDDTAVRECLKVVAEKGGERFFTQKNWDGQLQRVHHNCLARSGQFKLMSENDFRVLVASEFLLSRQLFEEEMGWPPQYLAFPWMLGSMASIKLAADNGIKALFGVGLDFRRAQEVGGVVPAFGRFKGDWLRFLPGRGRFRITQVLPGKMKSFLRDQHLAH